LVSFFEEKHLYTKQTNKQTNKQSHLVHSIKEMNGGKIKAIQEENEIRKAVIRTQKWRLRIKLQKENTVFQS
jgi:hypothetical protein